MRLTVASMITGSHVTTGPFGTPNHAPAKSTAVNVEQRVANRAWPPANRRKHPAALLVDRRCASPVTRSEHNTIRHTAKQLEVCSL
jgi:hypothetical protein